MPGRVRTGVTVEDLEMEVLFLKYKNKKLAKALTDEKILSKQHADNKIELQLKLHSSTMKNLRYKELLKQLDISAKNALEHVVNLSRDLVNIITLSNDCIKLSNTSDSKHHEERISMNEFENNAEPAPSTQLPQGPLSGSSAGDHDDHDSHGGPTYLTSSESKLFGTAAGSFNFSMAAPAADPTGLGGLNTSLQGNTDTLAGTSQGVTYRIPPPTSGGINEPQEQSDTLYACEFCHRHYSYKSSLTTHRSIQHRDKLKRLLKTTAIKNVLAQQPPPHLQ